MVDFVDSYRLYFKRTFNASVVLAVICLVGIATLFIYTDFDILSRSKVDSLLTFFFGRSLSYSNYLLVDLSGIWFFCLASWFSVALWRIDKNKVTHAEFSLVTLARQWKGQDLIVLGLVTFLSVVVDFSLNFLANSAYHTEAFNHNIMYWVFSVLYQLRICAPFLIFSFGIYWLVHDQAPRKLGRHALYLLPLIWCFHAIMNEFMYLVRNLVLNLLLAPFKEESYLIYESILGVAVIALFFVGFHSLLTAIYRVTEKKGAIDQTVAEL